MDASTPHFALLATSNYPQWSEHARAWFRACGLWDLVVGKELRPSAASSGTVTASEQEKLEDWDQRAMRAAGELYLLVSDAEKMHLATISTDPIAMWKKLAAVHHQSVLYSLRSIPISVCCPTARRLSHKLAHTNTETRERESLQL